MRSPWLAQREGRIQRIARGIRWRRWALGRRAEGHIPGSEGQQRDRPNDRGYLGAMQAQRYLGARDRWHY